MLRRAVEIGGGAAQAQAQRPGERREPGGDGGRCQQSGDTRFLRQEVDYATAEPPGTVVVDPGARFAYLVREKGRAIRYGVGVGREEAFNFRGPATIARKAEWPRWTPTPAMIQREPQRYGPFAGGLPGGTGNPLGPRALYLYRDGQDTL